jgi:glycolate oxidase iron-sulfur subunit
MSNSKVDNVLSVKPDFLASANPGCTLQIQKILRERGIALPAAHPIELLDASIAGGQRKPSVIEPNDRRPL